MAASIFWYDFETTGIDPILDRPIQFAGVRTDTDLNPLAEPVNLLCHPGHDVIPSPEAISVTGLSMLELREKGLSETAFCEAVLAEFSTAETCVCGYNSIRFDDEFTRQMAYRNLYDPYAREWQNGNSRWDVIDLFRMAQALRPEGLLWPRDSEDVPVFRLEALSEANGVEHSNAHDAVADVMATVELTRRLRAAQPRLYEFLFRLRNKREVLRQLYPLGKQAVVHVSSMYSARQHCTALVLPLCSHPTNSNGVICFDLMTDPATLIAAAAEEVSRLVFTSRSELGDDEERIPLKTVHVNRCPAIAPLATLRPQDADRIGIDLEVCRENMRSLQTTAGLVEKISSVFAGREFAAESDPDRLLYGGGFFSPADTAVMTQLHDAGSEDLTGFEGKFDDPRLDEMLFRYRARSFPDSLSGDDRERWNAFRREKWGNGLTDAITHTDELLTEAESDCLRDLKIYLEMLMREVGQTVNPK